VSDHRRLLKYDAATELLSESLAIYVHIPYCRKICPYCDFNVYALKRIPEKEYVSALIDELETYAVKDEFKNKIVTSLYFGGGTPSVFSPEAFELFLKKVRQLFRLAIDSEITIEANPLDLDYHKASALKDLGVNRVSLGVQSLISEKLKLLGRDHSPKDVEYTFNLLRKAGFSNINLDLIFHTPEENPQQLQLDLSRYCEMNPEHISAYGLTIEPGTPFFQAQARGRLRLPDEDVFVELFNLISSRLSAAGYDHYEISNYAKPEKYSRHNQGYWKFHDYLGLGAGAHSAINTFSDDSKLVSRCRWANYAKPDEYIASSHKVAWQEQLDSQLMEEEFILLALRMSSGLDLPQFRRFFGRDLVESRRDVIKTLADQGLLEVTSTILKISPQGRLITDSIIASLLTGESHD
jgi:oxygen-independent coproporphyrinogen III oxidase